MHKAIKGSESSKRIRILLVDDHAVMRSALKSLLGSYDDMVVVGEAKNGNEAIEQAMVLCPDIVLMDVIMPLMDGIRATRVMKERMVAGKIIILTTLATDDVVCHAVSNGAYGVLAKSVSADELLQVIRDVHSGLTVPVLPSVSPVYFTNNAVYEHLTRREVEILKLLAYGKTNKAISEALFISEGTVRSHVSSIFSKVHANNRVEAALYALREGIVSLVPPVEV